MADQVEQMFSVRDVPWHKPQTGDRTTVTQDYPQTFAEARTLAGLDWDPVAMPAVERVSTDPALREAFRGLVLSSASRPVTESVDALMALHQQTVQPDPEFRRIARSDTGATLSYQRDSYHIITNGAFGEIIDSVTGAEPGAVKLETGGCLAGGRKVWMLARLDEPMQVAANGRTDASVTFPFLAVTSSHDGHASCAARLTAVRIVCANTFSTAEAEGKRTGAVFSFSHRGDWRDRIDEARRTLRFARDEARDYNEAMSELLGIPVTSRQEQLWLREFIPEPPDGIISDRVARNITEARRVVTAFLDSPTIEGSGIRGTAYGLVQAAGEYLDNRASRGWESRLNRSLLKIEPLKAKAAVLAREAALQ